MTENPIADRYAESLFGLVKDEGQLDAVMKQLHELGELLSQYQPFREFLLNPDVDIPDKLRVLDQFFEGRWSPTLRAFIQVVLTMGRVERLDQIVEAFRALVDVEQRRVRALVRTAHPLSSALRETVKRRLEQTERRQVELTEEVLPELIGGIQILFDRRIFDGSIATRLIELRQQLKSVRVY